MKTLLNKYHPMLAQARVVNTGRGPEIQKARNREVGDRRAQDWAQQANCCSPTTRQACTGAGIRVVKQAEIIMRGF